jgi:hypothetical protein
MANAIAITTAASSMDQNSQPTSRSRRQRRRRRQPSSSFSSSTGCCPSTATIRLLMVCAAVAVVLLVWVNHHRTTSNVHDSANMVPSSESSSSSSSSGGGGNRLLFGDFWNDFPETALDLWPRQYRSSSDNNAVHGGGDDNNFDVVTEQQQLQRVALRNCLPSDSVYCHERWIGTTQHVAIVRPPGVLGGILEDFVLNYIEASRTEDMDMVVKVHSAVSVVHDYTLTQIVRPTVLPILFHAMDLILETLDDDDDEYTIVDVTVRDVESVVRLLTRWHCHLSTVLTDTHSPLATATWSVSLADAMAYPQKTQQHLAHFLGLHHNHQDDVTVNMNGAAESVLNRLDECTLQLQQLLNATTTTTNGMMTGDRLVGAVRQALRAELSQCDHKKRIAPDEFVVSSRVTQLISSFLGDGSTYAACHAYPHAKLCQYA